MAGTQWDMVTVSLVMCHPPAPSDPEPSVSCSEGVFKCPEDQLPLDYAKVSLAQEWVPCSKGTSSPRGRPQAAHSAWHSHAGLARAPGRKQEPFVPRAGERKPAPNKGHLLVCRGGSGPGQRAQGSQPGCAGGSVPPQPGAGC